MTMRLLSSLFVIALTASAGELRSLKPTATLPLGKGEFNAWAHCPTKGQVAALVSKRLVVGTLDASKKKLTLGAPNEVDAWAMAWTRDCSRLGASESSGDAKHRVFGAALFDVKDGALTRVSSLSTFRFPVSSIAMTDDDAFVAVAANSGELVIFRLDPKGAAAKVFEAPALGGGDQYLHVAFGRGHLLAGAYKGSVRLFSFDAATGALGKGVDLMAPTAPTRAEGSLNVDTGAIVMPGGARVFEVAFSNDGNHAWAVVESGQVFAWELGASVGPRVTVLDRLEGANRLALAPDGKQLAAAGSFVARVWRLDGLKATPLADLAGLEHVEQYVLARGLRFVGAGRLAVATGGLSSASVSLYSP